MKTSSFLKSLSVLALLASTAPAFAADPVVAVVDGKNFTYSEVMKAKALLPKQYQSLAEDKIFPILLNQAVDTYLLDLAAQASDVKKSADVKKAIEKATQDVVAQAYIMEQVNTKVTDAAVEEKAKEVIKLFKPEKEVHLFHILVDAENVAKSVIKALKGGAEFKKLAESKSKDATAQKGGDLGFFRKGELPKELGEAAFALAPGSYSEAPVKTDFGWHVLQVTELRDAKPPTVDEIKGEVKALLTQEAIVKLLDGLREKAKVQLFDKDGKPLPLKPEAGKAADEKAGATPAPAADSKKK